jgi:hypothetical protein
MNKTFKFILLLILGSGVFFISCKKYSKYTSKGSGNKNTTYDCKTLKLNFNDLCKTKDGKIGKVTKDCKCEVKTEEKKFDCPKLKLNFRDKCKTKDGKEGFVNKDCGCETKTNEKKFDCPKLKLNFRDKCKTKDGKEGIVNKDCGCESNNL